MGGRRVLHLMGVAIGLGAGLFAAWLCKPATRAGLLGQALHGAELTAYDYRLAWAASSRRSPDIAIVTMDEESFAQPELSIWPWPRRLREFTSFCSSCSPAEVVRQVNKYLSIVTEVILEHGGTVYKFIGDGVMAVFGDPVYQDDHAAGGGRERRDSTASGRTALGGGRGRVADDRPHRPAQQ